MRRASKVRRVSVHEEVNISTHLLSEASYCFAPRTVSLYDVGLMSASNRVHIGSLLSGESEVFRMCMHCFGCRHQFSQNEMDNVIRAEI